MSLTQIKTEDVWKMVWMTYVTNPNEITTRDGATHDSQISHNFICASAINADNLYNR